MNLGFLPIGMAGVFLAGIIALVVGIILYSLIELGWRQPLSHGGKIAWAWLFAVILGAGLDTWHLLYIGVTPMQSPVTIARVLSRIHDPDHLGIRVIGEFAGASAGVMLGWLLWSGHWRRPRSGQAPSGKQKGK